MNFFKESQYIFKESVNKNPASGIILRPKLIDELYNSICKHFFEEFFDISKALEDYEGREISLEEIYGDFGIDLAEYYPTLAPKFQVFLNNQVSWVGEILQTIKREYKGKKITALHLFKGDLHNRNKSTSHICLTGGSKIYIKPKALASEASFYTILGNVFPSEAVSAPNFNIKNFEKIEIMEDVEQGYNSSFNSEHYYYQFGIASSLFWLLSTGDIFDENIAIQSKLSKPAFIDLECLYTPSYSNVSIKNPFSNSGFRFQNSLIKSALFDTEFTQSEAQGSMTTSPLIKSKYLSIPTIEGRNGKIRHIKVSNGHFSTFIMGYRFGMNVLKKSDHKAIDSLLQNTTARFLFRNTRNYDKLIKLICSPEYYKFPQLINKVEKDYMQLGSNRSLLAYEFESVRELDIPVFRIKWNTHHIYDNKDKIIVSSLFKIAPKELFDKKCDILKSQNGINEEIGILERCFKAKYEKRKFLHSFSSDKKPLGQVNLEKISKYFEDIFLRIGDEVSFLEYLSNIDLKGFHISLTDASIYRGTTGVALVLVDLIKNNPGLPALKELEEVIYNQNILKARFIINRKLDVDEFAFFSLPTATIFHHLLRSVNFNYPFDEDLLYKYLDWCLLKIEKDRYGDILVGFSGIALFLVNNINLFGVHKDKVNNVIWAFIKVFEKKYSKEKGDLDYKIFNAGDNSFSHGLSGYIFVLNQLIQAGYATKALGGICDSLSNQLFNTFSDKVSNWHIKEDLSMFCDAGINHGNTGILLALSSIPRLDNLNYDYLSSTIENVIKYSKKNDISIANGSLGDALAFNMLADHKHIKAADKKKMTAFIQTYNNSSFYTQIKEKCLFLQPGLVTGIAGLFHLQTVLKKKNSYDLLSFTINKV